MTRGLLITWLVLALGMAFLLSGMEVGVSNLSRFRIRRLARQGDRRATRLQRYLDDPENFLWTILVGNTVATWAVITLVTVWLHGWLGAHTAWFVGAVMIVLFAWYVFADLLPKLLFRRFPNRCCLAGVGPFRVVHVALAPIVGVTEWISDHLLRWTGGRTLALRLFDRRAELRHAIQESATSLSREEVAMINRILDLQKLKVRDFMTPMNRAATLEASSSLSELLDLVRERQVSYVPLWKGKGNHRRVLGVVALASILFEESHEPAQPIESLVQPALFVDEAARLEDALRWMQRGRQRLAIVLDDRRAETGVITLNDILRAMFGEIRI